MNHFRRELLPPAGPFYERELGRLSRPNHKGWSLAQCPFHKSGSGRSFSVNVQTGGFYCFGCDAKGGDIVAFVMLRDGCTFKEACQWLNCWDEGGQPVQPHPMEPAVPYLTMDFVVDGIQYSASIRDEPLDYADEIRRSYIGARDRLREISWGAPERFTGEQDDCWALMACLLDERRELERENYEHE